MISVRRRGSHWLSDGSSDRRSRGLRGGLRRGLRHCRGSSSAARAGAENRRGRGRVRACRAQSSESRAAGVTSVGTNVRRNCFTIARQFGIEGRLFRNDET